jgi:hypothetical protein
MIHGHQDNGDEDVHHEPGRELSLARKFRADYGIAPAQESAPGNYWSMRMRPVGQTGPMCEGFAAQVQDSIHLIGRFNWW